MEQCVKVGIANEKEKILNVEDIKNWSPKNIIYFSDTVYFKNDSIYYAMKRTDFNNIFNNK